MIHHQSMDDSLELNNAKRRRALLQFVAVLHDIALTRSKRTDGVSVEPPSTSGSKPSSTPTVSLHNNRSAHA